MKTPLLNKIKHLYRIILCLNILVLIVSLNAGAQSATPWLTKGDKSVLFEQQLPVNFTTDAGTSATTITVDTTQKYQSIDGFGYCLTEGSAEVISSLGSSQQDEFLHKFFDPVNGIGVSVLRISIGASDMNATDYSYDDITSGTDTTMAHFSLAGPDLTYLIPILKKILAINPDIKILSTPWSAPKWMKTNNAWIGGSLNASYYKAYALYFVKYIKAMQAQGIKVWAITPQNEPENPNNEPSMTLTSAQETDFINKGLGPAFRDSGITTKIIAYDHNCDDTNYPTYVCKNSSFVDGSAFHLYGGQISALTTVYNATGKNVYFTEQYTGSNGDFSGDLGWHMQNVMVGSMVNWAKTAIEWNFATNASYGPHTPGGCTTCQGAATITSSTDYTINVSYYIVAHMSKVIKPNAVRIASSGTNADFYNAAFKNPDGSVALVVYNSSGNTQSVKVKYGSVSFTYDLDGASVVSFIWNVPTAVESPSGAGEIRLMPNPVKNTLTVSFPVPNEFYDFEIFDISGKEVYSQTLKSKDENVEVSTSALSSGTYIIQFNGKAVSKQMKFVKK